MLKITVALLVVAITQAVRLTEDVLGSGTTQTGLLGTQFDFGCTWCDDGFGKPDPALKNVDKMPEDGFEYDKKPNDKSEAELESESDE